ncbi:MAG: deoxyribodipyrimidine photo-lyase [Phycisphaerales bacterium]|nr:deoxyribodipyrimidine photo-lyase [Phycisphaerales bacterium]
MTRPLIWFRSDLRTHDNPALFHACRAGAAKDGKGVVAAFLVADHQWAAHDWGDPKADFICRSVAALAPRLANLGVPLVVRRAPRFRDAASALTSIAQAHACTGIWFNNEHELNETRRDEAVAAAFQRDGRSVSRYHDQVLFAPGTILSAKHAPYTVFTPFKNAWLRALADRASDNSGLTVPVPQRQAEPVCDSEGDPIALSRTTFSPPPAPIFESWPAGEAPAIRLLDDFTRTKLVSYHLRRDLPALDGTSRLSPHLAAGSISPRRCLHDAISSGLHHPGAASWITELIWREFYRHLLVAFPRLSMGRPFALETTRLQWRTDPAALALWKAGRTGFPIVDAAMRQLAATGWMHNRLRMIAAMFLTKDLLIHWHEGERHFMRSLVDADLASNNGGWQWSASTGTDAAPYFRVFNPVLQSRKIDPDGLFIRRWVPELATLDGREIHEPSPLARTACDYPPPIVDHAAARLRAVEAFKAILH